MSKYVLIVTAVDPHPKAGQPDYNSYGMGNRYPETQERQVINVELTEEEYRAVKRAILEVQP